VEDVAAAVGVALSALFNIRSREKVLVGRGKPLGELRCLVEGRRRSEGPSL